MRWRVSDSADRDLTQLYLQGIERFGFAQAEKYFDDLHAAFDRLAAYPNAGRLRQEVTPPVRMLPFRSHLIFYDIEDDGVVIVRVRHGFEDWWSEGPIRD